MAEINVTQFLSIINQELESKESLNEYLSKAEALTHIAMGNEFLDHPAEILYSFLWVLSDIIEHARIMNERSLNDLLKQRPLPKF